VELLVHLGEKRSVYRIMMVILKEIDQLVGLDVGGRVFVQMNLKLHGGVVWNGFMYMRWLSLEVAAACFEHSINLHVT